MRTSHNTWNCLEFMFHHIARLMAHSYWTSISNNRTQPPSRATVRPCCLTVYGQANRFR
ncbi:hypothetical protein GQ53DRAFT_204133 [Thozetella sp. PMI_491]|nr:hypothetical protein GQ53DRAFT_204133 [Thozetella sp. PMI_491]